MTPHSRSLSLSRFLTTLKSSDRDWLARKMRSVNSCARTRVDSARASKAAGVDNSGCRKMPETDSGWDCVPFWGWSKRETSSASSDEGGIVTSVVARRWGDQGRPRKVRGGRGILRKTFSVIRAIITASHNLPASNHTRPIRKIPPLYTNIQIRFAGTI